MVKSRLATKKAGRRQNINFQRYFRVALFSWAHCGQGFFCALVAGVLGLGVVAETGFGSELMLAFSSSGEDDEAGTGVEAASAASAASAAF